ncbi:H-NS histone (plasmid) [Burkholderia sp. MSMB0856]|uniref:H-NS histone family protein n=1 Tax=Burkholderia sp. MSMB0856 TaxID=1637869 RepID=UPI0008573710|nr:H-NS histone family protein [Burkholderia sp. MSMB0856]AOJ85279.1 H-NS histone [Burkholderia sp. MSMB0856]
MDSYRNFKKRTAELEALIASERQLAAPAVLEEIRMCIREFGFTPQDVFSDDVLHHVRARRARYYDPVSGATWSGVGREPLWIRGKDRSQFELPVEKE